MVAGYSEVLESTLGHASVVAGIPLRALSPSYVGTVNGRRQVGGFQRDLCRAFLVPQDLTAWKSLGRETAIRVSGATYESGISELGQASPREPGQDTEEDKHRGTDGGKEEEMELLWTIHSRSQAQRRTSRRTPRALSATIVRPGR